MTKGVSARRVKKILGSFGARYAFDAGVIEGDASATLVMLNGVSVSCYCTDDRNKSFGCPAGELALLVEWLPVEQKPRPQTGMVFPKNWGGLPVYYKRSEKISAR